MRLLGLETSLPLPGQAQSVRSSKFGDCERLRGAGPAPSPGWQAVPPAHSSTFAQWRAGYWQHKALPSQAPGAEQ